MASQIDDIQAVVGKLSTDVAGLLNEKEHTTSAINSMVVSIEKLSLKIDNLTFLPKEDFAAHLVEVEKLKQDYARKEDVKDLMKAWELLTSTLGKLLVGAFVIVLIVAAYQFVTNQIPQIFSGAKTVIK